MVAFAVCVLGDSRFLFCSLEAGVAVLSACEVAQQPYERLIPTPASSAASDFFEDYIVCGGREVTQALTKPARGTRSTKEKERVRGPFIT